MAVFDSAILDIDPVPGSDDFNVVVHGAITNFSNDERGTTAQLECDILGDAPILNDRLFYMDSGNFILEGFLVPFNRQKRVSRRDLNEDIIGRDEIVGRLTLRNLTNGDVIRKRTNVVQI
jgi:hypothetical protein